MTSINEALAALLAATRGALEWHMESGELALSAPDGFQAPSLGRGATRSRHASPRRGPQAPPMTPRSPPHEAPLAPTPQPLAPTPLAPTLRAATLPPFAPPPDDAQARRPVTLAPTPGGLSPSAAAAASLQILRDDIGDCRACPLHARRKSLVFGVGAPRARLMIVADAPGFLDDYLGLPFVEDGQLLADMLRKGMGLSREAAYLTYLLKCPLAGGPLPLESTVACRQHLMRQVEIVRPEVILVLNELSAQVLLRSERSLPLLRGKFYPLEGTGAVVRVSFPLNALGNPSARREAWRDLQSVIRRLGLSPGANGA
ncbi:uracil-DNA glycosylase [Myxococcota bacterium]|nr:uracil-DNA glycosylase [Myxococcota bacterium]